MASEVQIHRRVRWAGGDLTRPVEVLAPPRPRLPVVRLNGIPLHAITEQQCVQHIVDELAAGEGGWVVTHNLDHLRRLRADPSFATLCEEATVRVADGMPLIWACALQGTPLPERVAGSNLISSLSAAAAEHDRAIFLLGGDPGTAEAAAGVLHDRHPSLRIVGTSCPEPGFERRTREFDRLLNQLCKSRPDIVFVALGSPKQEQLISRFRQKLPATWWLGVGISFSFVCGSVKRAPVWVQNIGLEWAHRLAQEPRRLARRYLVDGLPFALRLLASSALQRPSIGTER